MKRGFTLIELLVVIAIIAILAAILFPVFAQAKAQAKAASALSNSKQQALSVLMYMNDADDSFPMGSIWDKVNGSVCFGAAGCVSTWAWATAPYVKNGQLYNDPTTSPNPNYFGVEAVTDTYMPEFGYNYTYLGYWAPVGAGGATIPVSTNSSQGDQPSNTVMIGSKWIHADGPNYGNTYWFSTIPGQAEDSALESPDCSFIVQWCFSDWGIGGQWDTGGIFAGTPLTDGSHTGGVADRVANHITVGWTDGHASKQTPDQLAKGTNFNLQALPGAAGGLGNITIVHATNYPWMLSHDCALDPGANCAL